MNNVHPIFRSILGQHVQAPPPCFRPDEDAIARELAATYRAEIWRDADKLHKAAGEYATDLSLELCIDLVALRQLVSTEHTDADVLLQALRVCRSLQRCVDNAVRVVADARGIS